MASPSDVKQNVFVQCSSPVRRSTCHNPLALAMGSRQFPAVRPKSLVKGCCYILIYGVSQKTD